MSQRNSQGFRRHTSIDDVTEIWQVPPDQRQSAMLAAFELQVSSKEATFRRGAVAQLVLAVHKNKR